MDLFSQTVGPLTSCTLVHDARGTFNGIALVDFVNASHAQVAYTQYNGKMIDKTRPLKIALIYDSPPQASAPIPSSNPLSNIAANNRPLTPLQQPVPQRQHSSPHSLPQQQLAAQRVRRSSGQQQAQQQRQPNQPKPKIQTAQQLLARLAPIPLGERLGPMPAGSEGDVDGVSGGKKGLPTRKGKNKGGKGGRAGGASPAAGNVQGMVMDD